MMNNLIIVAGIVAFFLIEKLIENTVGIGAHDHHGHSHDHQVDHDSKPESK
jgi:zinc transporter ZupT